MGHWPPLFPAHHYRVTCLACRLYKGKYKKCVSVEITICGFSSILYRAFCGCLSLLIHRRCRWRCFQIMCVTGGSRDVRVRFNMTISFIYCFCGFKWLYEYIKVHPAQLLLQSPKQCSVNNRVLWYKHNRNIWFTCEYLDNLISTEQTDNFQIHLISNIVFEISPYRRYKEYVYGKW